MIFCFRGCLREIAFEACGFNGGSRGLGGIAQAAMHSIASVSHSSPPRSCTPRLAAASFRVQPTRPHIRRRNLGQDGSWEKTLLARKSLIFAVDGLTQRAAAAPPCAALGSRCICICRSGSRRGSSVGGLAGKRWASSSSSSSSGESDANNLGSIFLRK